MTREQIIDKWETLDPRARDAWVALAVFKWRIMGDQIFPPEGEQLRSSKVQYEDGRFSIILPNYTTDIAAAWTVVDESAKWGGMQIGCYGKPDARYYEVYTYTDTHPYSYPIDITKETAPEAIGLAAIIAKLSTAK
ncbi:hypothetical protein JNUCC32_31235 (plasmid) [Paenibacillus sp. JNUCC32]|uniref:BC1872 family protein n=1 Tax=Paenibacillus sp. JNUCC32 TaxID=2777984 RepID=UPI00178785D3|nr:hypothetical protein [Paenibacillus sp. JNUCC-32]QOT13762.1 hypothetical protein JNUCC32_31235 [Paenibacillus sp. JNUCC-32]